MSMYRRRLMIANALKRSDGNINYPGLIAAWSAKGKTNDDAGVRKVQEQNNKF